MSHKLDQAQREYSEALDRLAELQNDTTTPADELAAKLSTAREAVAIYKKRVDDAWIADRESEIRELQEKARAFREQAKDTEAQAVHFEKTAFGQLAGLFGPTAGDVLRKYNYHPVKAKQLHTDARNFTGYAEACESDIRSIKASITRYLSR